MGTVNEKTNSSSVSNCQVIKTSKLSRGTKEYIGRKAYMKVLCEGGIEDGFTGDDLRYLSQAF